MISDFRLGFRFQTRARQRNRNREFDFRFQISDSHRQGGIEIKSFISISGLFDFRRSVLRETKSNLEMISGFHFDFKTELSMTQHDRAPTQVLSSQVSALNVFDRVRRHVDRCVARAHPTAARGSRCASNGVSNVGCACALRVHATPSYTRQAYI